MPERITRINMPLVWTLDYTDAENVYFRPVGEPSMPRSMTHREHILYEAVGLEQYPACDNCTSFRLIEIEGGGPNNAKCCSNCKRSLIQCPQCDSMVFDYEMHHTHGIQCCRTCWNSNILICEDCGDNVAPVNLQRYTEQILCMNCPRPLRKSDIKTTYEKVKSRRCVGVEIEFIASSQPSLYDYGECKDDGSIEIDSEWNDEDEAYENGEQAIEFASVPISGDAIETVIRKICREIKNHAGYVNETCGLHIHVDMCDSTRERRQNVMDWWRVYEDIFLGACPESRRSNTYAARCSNLTDMTWSSDRYRTLNVQAYDRHSTFEFRLHQGTVNADKILGWIALCRSFVDTFMHIKHDSFKNGTDSMSAREKLILLFQQVNMPLSLRKYLVRRIKTYNTEYKYIDIAA